MRGALAWLTARPRLVALLGAFCIAFSGIFFRFSGVSPSTATVFRCLYAVPFLLLLAGREDRRLGPRTPRARLVAVLAGVFFAADLVAYHHGVLEVGAGLGTVMPNLQVVIVALVGWLLLGERPESRQLLALPVVVGGALLISGLLEHGAFGHNPALGVVFGLVAGTSYAGFLLVIRQGNRDARRPFGTLLDASVSAAIVAGLSGIVAGDLDLRPAWPAHGWLVLLAITSQVVGYGLINVALPRLPAVVTSIILFAQPVTTLVFGSILLSEAPSPLQLGGVALILAGVLFATSRRSPPVVGAGAAEPA
jgi:drug/metabolite transporter (DMT)-like permease